MLAPVLVLGCIAPPTLHVIRPYNIIETIEGKRPRLFIRYRPMNHLDHIVSVNTPGGRVHLDIGGALTESYREGLEGFFTVVRYRQYADYVANVDFDTLQVLADYEAVSGGDTVKVDITLRHSFSLLFSFDNSLEERVPIEAHASREVPDGDREYLGRETARIIQEMLPQIERGIYEYILATDEPGKYVRH